MIVKFTSSAIFVRDIKESRRFYEELLEQKVEFDHGECISFIGGFSIWLESHASKIVFGESAKEVVSESKRHGFELYFEVDELDVIMDKIKTYEVDFVHPLFEQPWGQRAFRIYDVDRNIVEIGEPMTAVLKRFIRAGLTIEEAAIRSSMPVEFVRKVSEEMQRGGNEVSDELFLVDPDVRYKDQFLVMVSEYENSDDKHKFDNYKEARDGFEQYVDELLNYAKGINVPEDWVPYHTYWLTNGENQILGTIRIRTSIEKDYVGKYAGHIGYDISPLHRQRGYGKEILRLGLEKARMLGLDKVLITCKHDNIGSIKIIESNGGVYESEIYKESEDEHLRRYWIG